MKRHFFLLYIACLHLLCACSPLEEPSTEEATVTIRKEGNQYVLYRHGKPYYIQGGSGDGSLAKLKEIGGNSIRTYTTENGQQVLDEAHALGLTVTLGIWVEPYSTENDFSDTTENRRILDFIRREVLQYKDHPALLMWSVGNEVHPINPNISSWRFLSEACALVQSLDANHPVTTSIAGYPRRNIPFMNAFLDHVDLVSFNTFGGINHFKEHMSHPLWGYKGPYMLTEWGYYGYWSVDHTTWGSSMEPYTNSKAPRFHDIWTNYIKKDPDCLGGYVFYWGQKQELTKSWYSMFSAEGEKTLIVDTLSSLWGGSPTVNYPPHILALEPRGSHPLNDLRWPPHSPQQLRITYEDHEQDSVHIEAELRHESSMRKNISGIEQEPREIPHGIQKIEENTVYFTTPEEAGIYRLYVKITDGQGNCDMANVVFLVTEPANETTALP